MIRVRASRSADRFRSGVRLLPTVGKNAVVRADAPRLILVEDETALAAMLCDLFRDDGYAVDVAADGQAGLHYGLTRTYEVVVLDRPLPVVEGLDLIEPLAQPFDL